MARGCGVHGGRECTSREGGPPCARGKKRHESSRKSFRVDSCVSARLPITPVDFPRHKFTFDSTGRTFPHQDGSTSFVSGSTFPCKEKVESYVPWLGKTFRCVRRLHASGALRRALEKLPGVLRKCQEGFWKHATESCGAPRGRKRPEVLESARRFRKHGPERLRKCPETGQEAPGEVAEVPGGFRSVRVDYRGRQGTPADFS